MTAATALDALDALEREVFAPLVWLEVLDADAALDEARRFVWLSALTGKPMTEVAAQLGPTASTAIAVACQLDHVWEACEVIERVRVLLWSNAFPNSDMAAIAGPVAQVH